VAPPESRPFEIAGAGRLTDANQGGHMKRFILPLACACLALAACFEYRIDDEAPTSDANGGNNWNSLITDGIWDYTCQAASSVQMTLAAVGHVDIRMGFGAESDERFDWTRFYALSLENKDQCRDDEWEALGFKNLGQCVRFVETGRDSRVGD
jgi:hypothetical protein